MFIYLEEDFLMNGPLISWEQIKNQFWTIFNESGIRSEKELLVFSYSTDALLWQYIYRAHVLPYLSSWLRATNWGSGWADRIAIPPKTFLTYIFTFWRRWDFEAARWAESFHIYLCHILKRKIFCMYFEHKFSTGTIHAAQLTRRKSPPWGRHKIAIRGPNSTRIYI